MNLQSTRKGVLHKSVIGEPPVRTL